MRIIKGDSLNRIYARTCHALLNDNDGETHSKGRNILELHNCALELTDPRNNIVTLAGRNLSTRYLAGELAFYLAGSDSLAFIAHYSKFWRGISDDGVRVNSCYGKRLFREQAHGRSQLQYVIARLLERKETRKAVALIYKERDTNSETLDNPCTMYLHFCVRNNKLHLTVHMRSNDIWFGTPYDVFFFTILQQYVLVKINEQYNDVQLGTYTHIANSLHLYEKDREGAKKCAHELDDIASRDIPFGASPEFGKRDAIAINAFLLYEESRRNAPGFLPGYYPELGYSPFFRLMVKYLEGKKCAN